MHPAAGGPGVSRRQPRPQEAPQHHDQVGERLGTSLGSCRVLSSPEGLMTRWGPACAGFRFNCAGVVMSQPGQTMLLQQATVRFSTCTQAHWHRMATLLTTAAYTWTVVCSAGERQYDREEPRYLKIVRV